MTSIARAIQRILVACVAVVSAPALADDISVEGGWARASIGAASNSAAYMTLLMKGDGADRLIGAATPLAERAELHSHMMEDGVARMRPVEAIDIAPGESVALEPGGLHIMLMGLKEKLEPGAVLPLTLLFEQAGEIAVELQIQPVNYRPKASEGDG